MTPSERIVSSIAKKSFLSFWSFPNPIRKDNNNELTDLLIVHSPIVIIISVKEIHIKPTGDPSVDSGRWYKKAVEKSASQIYGAERIIRQNITSIVTSDKKKIIRIPDLESIQIYRIGISIGRKPEFALPFGRFDKEYIHFFDQDSFPILLGELDTITDFIEYLSAKESKLDQKSTYRFKSEEDLLAVYLNQGRKFPEGADIILIESGSWNQFIKKPEFARRKEQEKESYIWDNIIEEFFDNASKERILFESDFNNIEQSLRTMSRESRFSRTVLANSFLEFIGLKKPPEARARMCVSPQGITYVFLLDNHREDDRSHRITELRQRCIIARIRNPKNPETIGIATNPYKPGEGHSYDLFYMYVPDINENDKNKIEQMSRDLGYFSNPIVKKMHLDEYPPE